MTDTPNPPQDNIPPGSTPPGAVPPGAVPPGTTPGAVPGAMPGAAGPVGTGAMGTVPTPPAGTIPDPADVEKNKMMAFLGYILFLIPLLAAKDSPYAKFHANQGLNVFLVHVAMVLVAVIGSVALGAISALGIPACCCMPILWLLPLAGLVFAIMGIINALNGQMKALPLIGNITLLK